MRKILASSTLLLSMIGMASCAYMDDLVTTLPDMANFTDFRLFSGYLSVRGSGKYLHYMFAESQQNPAKDPLLIWFNGGPGCSSMLGYLQEHGPYVMEDETKVFHKNEYSWNKETNMLYIESPAGVGFSYCDDQKLCSFNDETSSQDNLDALLSFFAKFPEYRAHDLFISGESYAGVYVPYLAWRIDNYNTEASKTGKFTFNLKGFLVGNGVTNWKWDGDQSYVEMAFYHGLYGTDLKKQIKDNNCDFFYEDNDPQDSPVCQGIYQQFGNLTSRINVYDVYRRCFSNGSSSHMLQDEPAYGYVEIGGEIKQYKRQYTTKDYTPWVYNKELNGKRLQGYGELPPCSFGVPVIDYLNRKDIRQNLHIPDRVQAWEMCSDSIQYDSQHKASEWIYPLLKGKYRILFYSGSTDGAVPTRGSRQWITKMGWTIKSPWRQYLINDQVAGYVEERDGLTFATIHGVGHMAPQWKRQETYHLIFNWIQQKDI